MRKFFLLIALLASTNLLFATEVTEKKGEPMITGNVVDAISKKPISDVSIIAIHAVTKAEHNILTDANGNFKIATLPLGTYKFKFDKDNYRPTEKTNITIKQTSNAKINIEMVNYKDEDIEEKMNWSLKFNY